MTDEICGTAPILCAHLLRKVDSKLIDLLRSLSSEEWQIQTVAPAWKVRDVAAHLLDTPLRKLSFVRDGCYADEVKVHSPQEIVKLVNRLNREGATVYRRLSPPVLIALMEVVCEQSAAFHESLDPFQPAAFAVSWAGEERSLNWFDTARELTERWHHQQQIRLAANRPGIMVPELYHPVLDCFMRGLPHHFRDVDATLETTVLVEIAGDCGGKWVLRGEQGGWKFTATRIADPDARATIPQELAWRLFSKAADGESARAQVRIEGDKALGEKILTLTAIVG